MSKRLLPWENSKPTNSFDDGSLYIRRLLDDRATPVAIISKHKFLFELPTDYDEIKNTTWDINIQDPINQKSSPWQQAQGTMSEVMRDVDNELIHLGYDLLSEEEYDALKVLL